MYLFQLSAALCEQAEVEQMVVVQQVVDQVDRTVVDQVVVDQVNQVVVDQVVVDQVVEVLLRMVLAFLDESRKRGVVYESYFFKDRSER